MRTRHASRRRTRMGGGHSVRALVAYAEFMVKTGMLKTKPDSWKDVFFPYVYEKGGS
jgi:hypothetical protein